MARYLLITFDDNATAEEFAAALKTPGAMYYMGTDGHFKDMPTADITLRGVFAKPTKFCECPDYDPKEKTARSKNYNWYVHKRCGKPRIHQMHQPKNLLDGEREDKDSRLIRTFLVVKEPL